MGFETLQETSSHRSGFMACLESGSTLGAGAYGSARGDQWPVAYATTGVFELLKLQ